MCLTYYVLNGLLNKVAYEVEMKRKHSLINSLQICLFSREGLIIKRSRVGVVFMLFNATFNNISVISWRSVLLVEDTGDNHRSVASH
jgi:hypothetical protein